MGLFVINSAEIPPDYKPLIFNYNVIRGSYGINLKRVYLHIYESYITGDNEQTVTIDDAGTGNISSDHYANPIGLPVNFTPANITINSAPVVNLGTDATVDSVTIVDDLGNPLTYPATVSTTLNSASVAFTLQIINLFTMPTPSSIEISITVDDGGANSITKTIIVNILNDS